MTAGGATRLRSAASRLAAHPYAWVGLALCGFTLAALVFEDASRHLWAHWQTPEFSHGLLIPLISGFLLWRLRDDIAGAGHGGRIYGLIFITVGVLLLFVGDLSTIYSLLEFGLVITIIGLSFTIAGKGGMVFAIGPLVHLFLMIPIPDLIYNTVSQKLQLISSALGVGIIRLMNIPVVLEGNMIDLGGLDLQVAEACNGLRYAYPLTSLAYIIAFSFKGAIWQKLTIIASALPLAILMNSLRIGLTGAMVDRFGISAAEGFLHYFEGWVIFLLCIAALFGVVAVLGIVLGKHRSLVDCLDIAPRPRLAASTRGGGITGVPREYVFGLALLLAGAIAAASIPDRTDRIPERVPLVAHDAPLGAWRGKDYALDKRVLTSLKVTDYKLADYTRPGDLAPVSLYISYYASQRKGAAVHSPAACIPAGGWEIISIERRNVEGAGRFGQDLQVNRVLINRYDERQLVYYWFDQRGAAVTSALEVKVRLFWDALIRRRTDGAMIRLVAPLAAGEDVSAADERLSEFAREIYPTFAPSLPR